MAETEKNLEEQFLSELHWCITQLQLGLETQNPNSRQAREAEKSLKILCSSKAPVVKKRSVMRNIFGDYRQKIREAEKKSASKMKHIKMTPAVNKDIDKSVFYKKCSNRQSELQNTCESNGQSELTLQNTCERNSQSEFTMQNTCERNSQSEDTTGHPGQLTENKGLVVSDKGDNFECDLKPEKEEQDVTAGVAERLEHFSFVSSNKEFKFNFQVSEPAENSAENCDKVETMDTSVSSNSFKMEKSDNSFRFNFSDPS